MLLRRKKGKSLERKESRDCFGENLGEVQAEEKKKMVSRGGKGGKGGRAKMQGKRSEPTRSKKGGRTNDFERIAVISAAAKKRASRRTESKKKKTASRGRENRQIFTKLKNRRDALRRGDKIAAGSPREKKGGLEDG